MAKYGEIHKAIRQKFNIRRRRDSLPHGSHRGYTRNLLAALWAELGYNKGAEIGVRRGRFSMKLCQCNPDLELYCIDPWAPYAGRKYTKQRQDAIYNQAIKNLTPYNCKIIRKASMEAIKQFDDDSLDFVFIDGDHTFDHVCPDIIYWSNKVRSGGMVAVHDYYDFGWAGVVEAVRAYTHTHAINPWYVTKELEPTAYWVKP
jgi:predicted O-methyltransferase YrrM